MVSGKVLFNTKDSNGAIEEQKKWDMKKTSKIVDINPTIPIITLNMSELNTPLKGRGKGIKKKPQNTKILLCLQKKYVKFKDTNRWG